MRLSTRSRYGLHAMYELARCDQSQPLSIKAIAERQNVPEAYLEQLIGALRRSGLVRSVRGAQGGYRLSRAPKDITVGQVLRSMEGDLDLLDCLTESKACDKAGDCPTQLLWRRVRDGLNAVVDGITLQDMIDDYALYCKEEK